MNDVFDPLIGDAILVFYERTNCYYEAKVIEKRYDNTSKKPEYRVHYSGWNKRWDEWVKNEKILKVTPKNVETYGAVMNIRKRKRTFSEIKNENKRNKRQMKDDEKSFESEQTAQHTRTMSSTASPVSCIDASNDSDPSHGEEHKTKRRRRLRESSKGRGRSIAVESKQERGNEDGLKEGHTSEIRHNHGTSSNYVATIPSSSSSSSSSSYRHHRGDDDDDKNTIDIYLPIELKKKLLPIGKISQNIIKYCFYFFFFF
ncbi:hypothetical protein RFI_31111 [Reticulomyxa filosa]|uniref:Tudor-knot domain-containing protein n=1 Tax=Reticulomyxa filosa TaxID=46433 RepID=X6LXD4_RETFI|nr:hypothetical protein RFI_31111 [Reticulomyxa filosa]|eukprot:ETO06284.1 hypothetical protein RFI_31111 [Reticulomyxa filosa]